MANVIVIVYTTRYRKGGAQFPVVARTLAREKARANHEIVLRAVESKRDLKSVLVEVEASKNRIAEFHFVGHAGMYGPMFGTTAFPEQFSPYEWETLAIPFAPGARAFFHCCRSARWFAPFFARTFGVQTYGFFWYTTFSRSPRRYRYAGSRASAARLYTIGCKGRKSHGVWASLLKFAGLMPAETMKAFEPPTRANDAAYDATYQRVADLYDRAFADIRVRRDEWQWLSAHLPARGDLKVLDIGCGNGALLNAWSGKISWGAGADESAAMLERARHRNADKTNLEFFEVNSPHLPFDTDQFDVVVSLMSFRYLDWDPLLAEIRRVTKPDGRFLVVDMVTVPVAATEYPQLLRDKARAVSHRKANADFSANLRHLVAHAAWKKMVEHNPIRSQHEMKWYLESRFPNAKMEVLNVGWNARIVAFDSGAMEEGVEVKLSYP